MMKRFALISILLLVVFMWSCENKSSSPFAPEALTTLATNNGDGTVTVAGNNKGGKGKPDKPDKQDWSGTFSVDVIIGGVSNEVATGLPFDKQNNLVVRPMTLNLTAVNRGLCFSGSAVQEGYLAINERVSFWFYYEDIHYGLIMAEPGTGAWPPADGDDRIFEGDRLRLGFDSGKGGRKNSCQGNVDVDYIVTVTRID